MKALTERDFLYIIVLLVLLSVLTIGSTRGKGREVPLDDRHRSIYEAIKAGRNRAETELVCASCHSKSSLPLPKNHPPKEQCLICHQLATV